jgi:hypothetical protein
MILVYRIYIFCVTNMNDRLFPYHHPHYAVKAVGLHKCLRDRRLSGCSAFHWDIRSYCTDANLISDNKVVVIPR